MPTIVVNDAGAHLYYEDSGPPSADYTTLVLVHGAGFHGGKGQLYSEIAKADGTHVFQPPFCA